MPIDPWTGKYTNELPEGTPGWRQVHDPKTNKFSNKPGYWSPKSQQFELGSGVSGSSTGTTGSGTGAMDVSTKTTTTKYNQPMPTKPSAADLAKYNAPTRGTTPKFGEVERDEVPEFVAPGYNEAGEIEGKTQKLAARDIANLRTATQRSQAAARGSSDNIYVQGQLFKDTITGYGAGLGAIMKSAGEQAVLEYAQEYAYLYKTAGINHEDAIAEVEAKFQGRMAGRQAEYQAEMDAVNAIYSADVTAERDRVNTENEFNMGAYQAALASYMGDKTTTTTITEPKRPTTSKVGSTKTTAFGAADRASGGTFNIANTGFPSVGNTASGSTSSFPTAQQQFSANQKFQQDRYAEAEKVQKSYFDRYKPAQKSYFG